jgi:hypothetical protein
LVAASDEEFDPDDDASADDDCEEGEEEEALLDLGHPCPASAVGHDATLLTEQEYESIAHLLEPS